mmetsp:Transcript_6536/g.12345  ORF Transcript_6536/g.12345 Transcript_6536/m.12345 type:complete len:151 (+) Transcript_6536:46-498(+)
MLFGFSMPLSARLSEAQDSSGDTPLENPSEPMSETIRLLGVGSQVGLSYNHAPEISSRLQLCAKDSFFTLAWLSADGQTGQLVIDSSIILWDVCNLFRHAKRSFTLHNGASCVQFCPFEACHTSRWTSVFRKLFIHGDTNQSAAKHETAR